MLPKGLRDIVTQFQLCGEVKQIEEFGSGNINDTYRSVVRGSPPTFYIHQKINKCVFPHPEHVMENMALVTDHIRQKLQQGHSTPKRRILEIILTKAGQLYYVDSSGEYWRTLTYIPDAVTYDVVRNLEHAYEAGKVLGEFQRLVADIPPDQLHDTLPGFHHTPVYYEHFIDVLETSNPDPAIEVKKQAPEVVELIGQIQQRESLSPLLMEAYSSGALRNQVVHNDPKVNNILLDLHSQRGICMIDLDTVKAGLIHFDYGDCLRSAANPAGEKPRNIRQGFFDLAIFEHLTKGYLEKVRSFLSEADIEYLTDSIKVLTFELVIRFLTDYLEGDVHFKKIVDPLQNLNRARIQFALLEDIERKELEIRKILKSLTDF